MHRSVILDEMRLASCKCLCTPLLDLRCQRPSHQPCTFSVSKITNSDDDEGWIRTPPFIAVMLLLAIGGRRIGIGAEAREGKQNPC